MVIYELEYGIAKSSSPAKRRKQLGELCAVVEILPFAENEAQITAKLRADMAKLATPIGYYDILIAGIALSYHGVLATHNTSEFSRIPKLKIEDWF